MRVIYRTRYSKLDEEDNPEFIPRIDDRINVKGIIYFVEDILFHRDFGVLEIELME